MQNGQMPQKSSSNKKETLEDLLPGEPSKQDELVANLQEDLARERDARREDRFLFIVISVLLLDVVFFSVMDTFGGPIALFILELLILVPLAKRLGREEIAQILSSVLARVSENIKNNNPD